ncbi:hypothetical protein IVB14_07235 [Bradyrhizobium sp. 180]|uniref:hypothetical protein n=1 Tax=unclassified Bradyrhizobium TaxID=2631580 RepID=UPI001FFBC81A|nr:MULTISPECIES: hypothetical protein [unclassified Bradyrhizobium]MCK1420309.1 hypothetical protein [Bradyrhizobium sp. CW12]MCK1490219.1 hypothetical protein [Bradyrhizobium sp. 180]MCK1528356.1 hypothetical protein [Bradyrhizobium sp. 182]MCK1649353.1 hypothetical protein [Bradyrhizobium sp. 154]
MTDKPPWEKNVRMDQQGRKTAIRARIAEQIEAIATAICENRLPVAEELVLRWLTAQLAQDDIHPEPVQKPLPPPDPSRVQEARAASRGYAADQWAIAAKLRRNMN